MSQSHKLSIASIALIALVGGSLALGGCSSQQPMQSASTFPPIETGQHYELKTTSGLLASGAIAEDVGDWLRIDMEQTRSGGEARQLWIRKSDVEWLAKAQAPNPVDTQRIRLLREKEAKLQHDLDYSLNTLQRTELHPAVIKLRHQIENLHQQTEDAAAGR